MAESKIRPQKSKVKSKLRFFFLEQGGAIMLLLFSLLVLPSVARSQNDFPGGGFPTYPPGTITNFPVNGGQWQWGATKWGPLQLNARRGDTIVFDVVGNCSGCYWRFAYPLHASPIISAGTGMRLSDPYNDGPKWQHFLSNGDWVTFCVGRCEFQVEAGEDYPWLRLGYDGNSDWYNQIEIKQIIPAPPRQVVSPEKKAAAHAKADQQEKWAAGLNVLTVPACATLWWEVCAGLAALSQAFSLDASRLRAVDPWDWDYCTPHDPQYNWSLLPWYPLAEDGSAGPWGMAPWVNGYMWTATVIDGLHDMLYVSVNRSNSAWEAGDYGCSDMQYWRAQWALQTLGAYYGSGVGQYMYAFQWFFGTYWNPVVDLGDGPAYLTDYLWRMGNSYWELASTFSQ